MSERVKRQEKGVDYWIDRCDLAENILENFESVTNYILESIELVENKYVITDLEKFKLGVAKAQLEEHIRASHLDIAPFSRDGIAKYRNKG